MDTVPKSCFQGSESKSATKPKAHLPDREALGDMYIQTVTVGKKERSSVNTEKVMEQSVVTLKHMKVEQQFILL